MDVGRDGNHITMRNSIKAVLIVIYNEHRPIFCDKSRRQLTELGNGLTFTYTYKVDRQQGFTHNLFIKIHQLLSSNPMIA